MRRASLARLLELDSDMLDRLRTRFQTRTGRTTSRRDLEFGTTIVLAYMDAADIWKHAPIGVQACRRIRDQRKGDLATTDLSTEARSHFARCRTTTERCAVRSERVVNGWRCVTFALVLGVRHHAYWLACQRENEADRKDDACCSASSKVCRARLGRSPWGTCAETRGVWLVAWATLFALAWRCSRGRARPRTRKPWISLASCLTLCAGTLTAAHEWGTSLGRMGGSRVEAHATTDWIVAAVLEATLRLVLARVRIRGMRRASRVAPAGVL